MGRALLSMLGLGAAAGLTAVGGKDAVGIAAGLAANITTDAYKCLNRRIAERFIDGWSGIDENHHVSRGLRLAQINGLRAILKKFDTNRATDPDEDRQGEANRFSGLVKDFLDRETKAAQGMGFSNGAGISVDEQKIRLAVLEALPDTFDTGLAARRAAKDQAAIAESLRQLRTALEAGVLEEIRLLTVTKGEDFPAGYVELFLDKNGYDGWFDLFIRDAAADIKDGEEFEKIWNAEQVALIKAEVRQTARFLEERMDNRTERLLAYAAAGGAVQRATEQGISEAALRKIDERAGGPWLNHENVAAFLDNWVESAEQHKREQLKLLEGSIRVDALALNEAAIASKLRMMAKIEGMDAADALGEWLFAMASQFGEIGATKGSNPDLFIAIASNRAALEQRGRDRAPLDWAAIQNNLGVALWRLGERESGTGLLEEAVKAYRAAREEYTRDRVPLDWANTQNNLGVVLWRLGERESGTARLEEAVQAYRAALEERTRDRAPLDWAMTQTNLGNALGTLGARESGTARLEEAVKAYRAALEEYMRERVPLDWAMTQNNLGAALQTLGERESSTARLEEAVQAYRAALEEHTRDRVPLNWAMIQNNLGIALQTLGARESGTARLEEAARAYRAALEERTRDRVPLDWASTQNNLGVALWRLGERESGTARLKEAVQAYRAALEERTRDRVPLDWASTQNNLGVALQTLGERESDTARLKEAVQAYRAALEERTRDRVPLDWAMTQTNLGNALGTLGEWDSDTARLLEAGQAHRAALEERKRDRLLSQAGLALETLGDANVGARVRLMEPSSRNAGILRGDDEPANSSVLQARSTGKRRVNAWIEDGAPPLIVLRAYRVAVNIGKAFGEAFITKEFKEPEWHSGTFLTLLIVASGSDFTIEQPLQKMVLPREGDTAPVYFNICPLKVGELVLRLGIYLERDFTLLEEFEVRLVSTAAVEGVQ